MIFFQDLTLFSNAALPTPALARPTPTHSSGLNSNVTALRPPLPRPGALPTPPAGPAALVTSGDIKSLARGARPRLCLQDPLCEMGPLHRCSSGLRGLGSPFGGRGWWSPLLPSQHLPGASGTQNVVSVG